MSALLFPSLPHFSSCFIFSVRKHEWQLRWRLIPGDGLRLHCPAHTCFPLPSMPDLWPTQPQSLRVTESCLGERWRVSGMRELIWTSMPDLLPEENKRVYCCGKHSQQLLFNKLIFYILWMAGTLLPHPLKNFFAFIFQEKYIFSQICDTYMGD